MAAITATAAAVGGAALKAGWGPQGWGLIIASFLASAYNQASWLYSNDDFLGVLVPAANHGEWSCKYSQQIAHKRRSGRETLGRTWRSPKVACGLFSCDASVTLFI